MFSDAESGAVCWTPARNAMSGLPKRAVVAGDDKVDDVEQRATRAETLIHLGELSHARQVLEGAELAPGKQATLDALQDEERRPPLPRGALPPDFAAPHARQTISIGRTHPSVGIFDRPGGEQQQQARPA